MGAIFSKLFDFLGLLSKELRLLAIILIIHIISFSLSWQSMPKEHTLLLFTVSSIFLSTFLIAYCFLYYKLGITPYMIGCNIDGEWLYEAKSIVNDSERIVTGKCVINSKYSDVIIDGERSIIFPDFKLCKNDGCTEIPNTRCEKCDKCDKINQRWSTEWGAITKDKKLRFQYYFHLEENIAHLGYCVISLNSDSPNEMKGLLSGFPPLTIPADIIFRRK